MADLKMMAELKRLREQWEKGLAVLSIFQPCSDGEILVVLLNPEEKKAVCGEYHLHCYLQSGDSWEVSLDVQGGDVNDVFQALQRFYPVKEVAHADV